MKIKTIWQLFADKLIRLRRFIRHLLYIIATIKRLMGWLPRTCNCCGFHGHFYSFGQPPRFDAQCPSCGSLERHRLVKYWIDRNQDILKSADVLHVAPERALVSTFRDGVSTYVSVDIKVGRADKTEDVERLTLQSGRFNVVICIHVLEHLDDRAALNELSRVLRPGGLGLFMVPFNENWSESFEDESITSDLEKRMYFGQADHKRYYGRDILLRLESAGFDVEKFVATEPDVGKFGLKRDDTLFICRKKSAGQLLSFQVGGNKHRSGS